MYCEINTCEHGPWASCCMCMLSYVYSNSAGTVAIRTQPGEAAPVTLWCMLLIERVALAHFTYKARENQATFETVGKGFRNQYGRVQVRAPGPGDPAGGGAPVPRAGDATRRRLRRRGGRGGGGPAGHSAAGPAAQLRRGARGVLGGAAGPRHQPVSGERSPLSCMRRGSSSQMMCISGLRSGPCQFTTCDAKAASSTCDGPVTSASWTQCESIVHTQGVRRRMGKVPWYSGHQGTNRHLAASSCEAPGAPVPLSLPSFY